LHIQQQQQASLGTFDETDAGGEDGDDIDAALNSLEDTLQGSAKPEADITHVPELQEEIKYFR